MRGMRILFCLIFVIPLTLFPQDDHRVHVSMGTGVSFPNEPKVFSDYWTTGINFACGIDYSLTPVVSVGGSLAYNRFVFDGEELIRDFGLSGLGIEMDGGVVTVICFTGGLKINLLRPSKPVSPYVFGGIGLIGLSTGEITVTTPDSRDIIAGDSETAFMAMFGAGIDITIGERTKIFGQFGYDVGNTEGSHTTFFPLQIGIRLLL